MKRLTFLRGLWATGAANSSRSMSRASALRSFKALVEACR